MIEFVQDDGGRAAAGFRGSTGDCVTRAITIATGLPYREVYDATFERMRNDRTYMKKLERRYGDRAGAHVSPRNGVPRSVYEPFLREHGWLWTPTMHVGSGCTTHLTADELPEGRLIVRLSKHVAAVIDGVLHDTYDCSRDGTRCVYGYFHKPEVA